MAEISIIECISQSLSFHSASNREILAHLLNIINSCLYLNKPVYLQCILHSESNSLAFLHYEKDVSFELDGARAVRARGAGFYCRACLVM